MQIKTQIKFPQGVTLASNLFFFFVANKDTNLLDSIDRCVRRSASWFNKVLSKAYSSRILSTKRTSQEATDICWPRSHWSSSAEKPRILSFCDFSGRRLQRWGLVENFISYFKGLKQSSRLINIWGLVTKARLDSTLSEVSVIGWHFLHPQVQS